MKSKEDHSENEWLKHLEGKYEAPLAVKQRGKKPDRRSSFRQLRAIRRKPDGN